MLDVEGIAAAPEFGSHKLRLKLGESCALPSYKDLVMGRLLVTALSSE